MKRFIAMLQAWGPLGVFVIAILDSAGVPVVGGVDALVVLFAVQVPDAAYVTAAIAVAGSLIGSLILYYIARRGGEAYYERHTRSARAVRMKRWFLEYGLLTVFVPALVPIPMPLKLFIIAAGAFEVNALVFTAVLAAARVPRYFMLAWMGRRLGHQTLPYLAHHVWLLVGGAVALFAVLYVAIKLIDRRRRLREVTKDTPSPG